MMPNRALIVVAALALPGSAALAETVTLYPSKDNTLYESSTGSLSNGAGNNLFCGRTNQGAGLDMRRAVMAFDVAGGIPAGSTITAVTLTMFVEQTHPGTQTCSLHRLQQDWGEGDSVADGFGGGGGAAQPGDATWIHTFYDTDEWTNEGGDFAGTASATASVAGIASTPSWSGPGLVADVQAWLDDPAANFGWLLRGNESEPQTAKNFSSRETGPSFAPALEVTFDPPAASCPGDTNGDDVVDVNDLNNVILDWGTDGTAHGGDVTGPDPGSPPDGVVDVNDLNAVIVGWGACP